MTFPDPSLLEPIKMEDGEYVRDYGFTGEIPTEIELFTILNELPELEKMAVYIMTYRGLRVGALNKLKVWGNKY